MSNLHRSKFKVIECELDHKYENNAICPYCGFIDQDSWEIGDGDEGDFDSTCGHCEKEYRVSRMTRIEYSTSKKEDE